MELIFDFLTGELRLAPEATAEVIWRDYQRGGRRDKPGFLKEFLRVDNPAPSARVSRWALPKRQARHLG